MHGRLFFLDRSHAGISPRETDHYLKNFVRGSDPINYYFRFCLEKFNGVRPHKLKEIMRLDKYLKVSRLIKRRTVANEACDAGRVLVNDRPQRASYDVKVGDVIEIRFGEKSVRAEVLTVQETVHKEEAGDLFKYL